MCPSQVVGGRRRELWSPEIRSSRDRDLGDRGRGRVAVFRKLNKKVAKLDDDGTDITSKISKM